MKQYSENQYDDDLTVGTDDYDYDDSYQTEAVDLFEFTTDEESPISQLKSLILSIDWEITDEILMEFSEELIELRALWAGEKLNLVYIQALEKISKYIYHKKADSHPNAIKLLLTLYYNLEKVVTSVELSDEEKKKILLEDVKRFENLKREIRQTSYDVDAQETDSSFGQLKEPSSPATPPADVPPDSGKEGLLLNLRAIILGIDWEVTDEELNNLRQEVVGLEEHFADSKPKRILLQGIGTLGAYIKLKKGDAHADAFKVLHMFYDSLEQIVQTSMGLEEEKEILFPAVESFNAFKSLIGSTISEPETAETSELDEDEFPAPVDPVVPAFADIDDNELQGFQADEEARTLGLDESANVGSHVDNFFGTEDVETSQTGEAGSTPMEGRGADGREMTELSSEEIPIPVDKETALQGVDVEEEEYDKSASHLEDLVPALSDAGKEIDEEKSLGALDIEAVGGDSVAESEEVVTPSMEEDVASEDRPAGDLGGLDRDLALQGVEVETEADDDSDEEALPTMGGKLAPALAENEEVSLYNADNLENLTKETAIEEEILLNIDGLFAEEDEPPPAAPVVDTQPGSVESQKEEELHIDQQVDAFFGVTDTAEEAEKAVAAESVTLASTQPVSDPGVEVVVFELVAGGDEGVSAMAQEVWAIKSLPSLRGKVQSLESEFDNATVRLILQELTGLRHELAAKPLENTFIQLLLTVMQYLDKCQQVPDDGEVYTLLDSILDTLEQGQKEDMYSRQQRLLAATTEVLGWQQEQLVQQEIY